MEKLLLLVLFGTMIGCAQVERQQATHEWGAQQKKLRFTFSENNSQCAEYAANVSDYENCMTGRGYKLLARN